MLNTKAKVGSIGEDGIALTIKYKIVDDKKE